MKRSEKPELLDGDGHDPAQLAANLSDMQRVNKWLGGTGLTVRALRRVLPELRQGDELALIDIGAGAADIPCAIATWAQRHGWRAAITAVDVSPEIIGVLPDGQPKAFSIAVADGRRLPFAGGSFDVAICSLLLHHLSQADAVTTLAEMRRVARRGIIVNDLVRSWFGYFGALALTRTLTTNPLTRHDAPLSVQRAYTTEEMAQLAREAGLGAVTFIKSLGYRTAMIAEVRH
jgi:ubiquinone/menaquinone biosynthesis C-methylase UbiE